MRLLTKMLRQTAVYWPPAGTDAYGKPQMGEPIQLRVRWEDKHQEFISPDGTRVASNAMAFVETDGVVMGGKIMLGSLGDIDPAEPPPDEAWEVRQVDKIPTLKATKFLRRVYV